MSAAARSGPCPELAGQHVVFTGKMASMTRSEARRLVTDRGGRWGRQVTRQTTLLVIGQERWPLEADGRVTRNLRRAQYLQQHGVRLDVLGEDAFLERLGLRELGQDTCRRYSLAQLTKLVGLSRDRLRAWLRAGLIQPAETLSGVPLFDYSQVAAAKSLWQLSTRGVTTDRLRRSLEQLRSWLPHARESLASLHLLEGELLVRCDDGLAELNGQRLIDFDVPAEPPAPSLQMPEDAEAAFNRARRLEEMGEFDDAVQAYYDWLQRYGTDAHVIFNLANSLTALGRHEAALERYRQAVEVDPEYIEAWNNLGAALAAEGQLAAARAAFEAAIELVPNYADALYNLADTLDEMGCEAEARPYWSRYLDADGASPWADYARGRLECRS